MSRWFVKDGICPVQRRFGKNVAYGGVVEMGGWGVGRGWEKCTLWVFGHVRSTCAELMVLAVAPSYFVSFLCEANAENLVPLPVPWNAYPGAEKFLCKWHQVTEKLLPSQLTTHWSLWLWGVKMLTCRLKVWFICHSNVAGRRCIVRSSSMLLLRLAPCMLEPFRPKPTKLRQERTPILQEAVKRIWARHAAYSTDNRPMAVKS